MTIPTPALQQALSCLERFANHPDTAAIHDPIYALLQGDSGGQKEDLERALVAYSAHPAAVELRTVLGGHLELGGPTLASTLLRYGPLGNEGDLVHEVERRLHQHEQQSRHWREERDRLEAAILRARQSSNAIAALAAFGFMFALTGWAIALGLLDVQWMDAPVPIDPGAAEMGRGVPAPSHSRPKLRP